MTTASQSIASQTAEGFADKVFRAALGTMETFNLYLGDRLGWFDALAEASATAAELAERTNTHEHRIKAPPEAPAGRRSRLLAPTRRRPYLARCGRAVDTSGEYQR